MRWHTHARRRAQDLSPDTIIETSKGSAKVLDFGMSAWTHGGRTRALAAASPAGIGADAVTILSYVSPEQALSFRRCAHRHLLPRRDRPEMLTGLNPFAGADPAATLANVTQRAPPPPSSINPDLPKLVDVVVLRALNHALDRRTDRASKLASRSPARCSGLLDATSPSARASRSGRLAARRISLHSKKSAVWSVWWMMGGLGRRWRLALYYWLR